MTADFDAVILAGGEGRRMGSVDKALLTVAGQTLLERALTAVAEAASVVIVGPPRALGVERGGPPVTWCREDPPGGGPGRALVAGVARTRSNVVVVISVDTPLLDRGTVTRLVQAVDPGSEAVAAVLVDDRGVEQPLISAYRRSALQALQEPRSARAAVAQVRAAGGLVARLADADGASRDCDTPEQLHALDAVLRSREGPPR